MHKTFGLLKQVAKIEKKINARGFLTVASFDPFPYSIYRSCIPFVSHTNFIHALNNKYLLPVFFCLPTSGRLFYRYVLHPLAPCYEFDHIIFIHMIFSSFTATKSRFGPLVFTVIFFYIFSLKPLC